MAVLLSEAQAMNFRNLALMSRNLALLSRNVATMSRNVTLLSRCHNFQSGMPCLAEA
jgi:hypothetical protein